jgi:hypothetical protein
VFGDHGKRALDLLQAAGERRVGHEALLGGHAFGRVPQRVERGELRVESLLGVKQTSREWAKIDAIDPKRTVGSERVGRPISRTPPYNPAAAPSQQFGNPVHCIRIDKDGLVYVCDRTRNRMQIFRKNGTFVSEHAFEKNRRWLSNQRDAAGQNKIVDPGHGALPQR